MKKSLFLSASALAIAVVGAFAFTAKSTTVTYYLNEGGTPVTKTASSYPCPGGSTIICQALDGGTNYDAFYDDAFQSPIYKAN